MGIIIIVFVIVLILMIVGAILPSTEKKDYGDTDFDTMDGYVFEKFCADLLKNNGFTDVKVTPQRGDHGIDVLATKNGRRYAVQCKRYSKNVGNKAIQEVYSGKAIYNAEIAVVLTNRYFTEQARADARKLGVQLWDRDALLKLIRSEKIEDVPQDHPFKDNAIYPIQKEWKCIHCKDGKINLFTENGMAYAKCDKCGIIFTKESLQKRYDDIHKS